MGETRTGASALQKARRRVFTLLDNVAEAAIAIAQDIVVSEESELPLEPTIIVASGNQTQEESIRKGRKKRRERRVGALCPGEAAAAPEHSRQEHETRKAAQDAPVSL